MRRLPYLAAVITELAGVAAIGVGIGMELALGGHIYLVLISGGSLLVATGGLIFSKVVRRNT